MAFFGLTIGYPLWKKFWQYFKSFGGALVGAKEVSKMLVLHEFLNLCASTAKIYYKAEASQISLVNTLFIKTRRRRRRST